MGESDLETELEKAAKEYATKFEAYGVSYAFQSGARWLVEHARELEFDIPRRDKDIRTNKNKNFEFVVLTDELEKLCDGNDDE